MQFFLKWQPWKHPDFKTKSWRWIYIEVLLNSVLHNGNAFDLWRWRTTALNHPDVCYWLLDDADDQLLCLSVFVCLVSLFVWNVIPPPPCHPSLCCVCMCRVWLCSPSSLSPSVSGSPRASWLLWGPSAPGGCHEYASPSGYCTHPLNLPQTKLIFCTSL